jgi:hypothetical protein
MKQVTIALDDDVYASAAAHAAEKNMSVSSFISSLVRQCEKGRVISPEEFERLRQDEIRLRERIVGISAKDNLSRDELYRRR